MIMLLNQIDVFAELNKCRTFAIGEILNVCDVATDIRLCVRLLAQAAIDLHQNAAHQLLGLVIVDDQLIALFPDLCVC